MRPKTANTADKIKTLISAAALDTTEEEKINHFVQEDAVGEGYIQTTYNDYLLPSRSELIEILHDKGLVPTKNELNAFEKYGVSPVYRKNGFEQVEENQQYYGVVNNSVEWGLFVTISGRLKQHDSISGLVHNSQINTPDFKHALPGAEVIVQAQSCNPDDEEIGFYPVQKLSDSGENTINSSARYQVGQSPFNALVHFLVANWEENSVCEPYYESVFSHSDVSGPIEKLAYRVETVLADEGDRQHSAKQRIQDIQQDSLQSAQENQYESESSNSSHPSKQQNKNGELETGTQQTSAGQAEGQKSGSNSSGDENASGDMSTNTDTLEIAQEPIDNEGTLSDLSGSQQTQIDSDVQTTEQQAQRIRTLDDDIQQTVSLSIDLGTALRVIRCAEQPAAQDIYIQILNQVE